MVILKLITKLTVDRKLEPIDTLGMFAAVEMHDEPEKYEVRLNGVLCHPRIRDIILAGLNSQMIDYCNKVEILMKEDGL